MNKQVYCTKHPALYRIGGQMIDIDKDKLEIDEDEREEVDEYAGLNGNYEEDTWEYLPLAQKAAAAGDYQRVKALLINGLDNAEIQRAFQAAAFNKRMDVAWLLIEAGAGFYNYDSENSETKEYCPVCLRMILTEGNLDDYNLCSHWVCLYIEGEYHFENRTDFGAAISALAQRLRKRDLPDEDFDRIIRIAPTELRILFKRARKYHDLYWTVKGEVLAVEHISPGRLASYCISYYHPYPGFAEKVKDEAQAGLAWLKKYFPEFCVMKLKLHGSANYFADPTSYDDEDEWDSTGEDEEATGKKTHLWFN